ncbi:TRAP transporter substrate-binding protein DctP, partial [candidate division KSB1 bacterium]
VTFRIYAGNQGDEGDILSKMRRGRIHAAGFTGRGLGEILPEMRVMEIPFLFKNYDEVDYVIDKLYDRFARTIENNGFVLLGWAEAGFVHFFSTKRIESYSDLKGVRMWTWQGDPLAEAMFKALGVVPNPLPLTDVATSLQTGLIDAVYVPPYHAIALQWAQKAKYVNNLPVTNAAGAVVMLKNKFDSLSPDHREILLQSSRKWLKELVELTRKDNEIAMNGLQKIGIEIVPAPTNGDLQVFLDAGLEVQKEMVGVLYTDDLLNDVLSYLQEYRSGR